MASCWLIGDWDGRFPRMAAQYARLRGLDARFYSCPDGELPRVYPQRGTSIVMSFDRLHRFTPVLLPALRDWVARGATLFVRGGVRSGMHVSLAPFWDGRFTVASEQIAASYRCLVHPLMPKALVDEIAEGEFSIPGAERLEGPVEPALVVRHVDGRERIAIFTIRCGAGVVIYDLNLNDEISDAPIVQRLADPVLRPQNIGALIAADRAAGRNPDRPAAFNLTLDDRPANLDFFNVSNLERFLARTQASFPGAHVDFGWTPNQSRPSRRYVERLKQYRAGFVWHGFLRHVDHRCISDPAREFTEGKRMVDTICRGYGIRFQPVMIFPFERETAECVEVLLRSGFRAKAQTIGERFPTTHPEFLRWSAPERLGQASDFTVLYRQAIDRLDRNWMLAQAALGLPVLAAAHPKDVALKRFARGRWQTDSFPDLDRVLEFARTKSLRPLSLEEISSELMLSQGAGREG